jgi:hypothetical protein
LLLIEPDGARPDPDTDRYERGSDARSGSYVEVVAAVAAEMDVDRDGGGCGDRDGLRAACAAEDGIAADGLRCDDSDGRRGGDNWVEVCIGSGELTAEAGTAGGECVGGGGGGGGVEVEVNVAVLAEVDITVAIAAEVVALDAVAPKGRDGTDGRRGRRAVEGAGEGAW